jgi:tripartite-type tricarboxylate transporter receptor subunit TctC
MGLAEIDYEELYPVNLLIEEPNLIVVPADSPYQTFTDLLDDVKARPGEVRMAHFGNGTTSQVITLMFQSVTDFDANMVPFDGAAAAMTASMGGALDVVNVGISIGKPMIESGRMRALTIISDEVHSHFPDVPPVTQFLPDTKKFLPWGPFYGVYADKDIPDAAKEKLSAAFSVATKDPKFSDMMNQRGVKILSLSGDEAVAYIKRYQSITAWLLYDGGATEDSPEKFGIARP